MPIKAEMRWFYPIDWPQLSNYVRFERAGGACQCCGRPHGEIVRCLPDGRWYDEARQTWRNHRGCRLIRPILKTLLAYGIPGLFWRLPTSTIIPETIG